MPRRMLRDTGPSDALLLRVEQVAARLGLGRSYTYTLIKAGTWPVVRIGKSVRIPAAALSEWVQRQYSLQPSLPVKQEGAA
jgi:excisionase family DNA binding protein